MADAGCQCVYVVDSAGALVLDQVGDRVAALVRRARATTRRSASTATRTSASAWPTRSLAARAGAVQIDGSTRRFGAGAGNTPVEAFVGVCDKLGIRTGVDFFAIVDAAEDVVPPGDARRSACSTGWR